MSEFIVLGLIPGTQLQITFILWLLVVIALIVASLVWLGHRTHVFRNWLITLNLLLLTRQTPIRL
jgi:hypothetical protein